GGDEVGRRCAGGLESSGSKNRRRFRLHVSVRPVFRSRRFAINRHPDCGLRLQIVDDSKGAARIFARRTLPIARRQDRRGTFSYHAGKRNFHSWSWPCPSQNNRARKSGRITGEDNRSARGRIERARVEGFAGTETGVRGGRNSSHAVGLAREGGGRFTGRILLRGGRVERPQNHWALFDFSGTCQAERWRRTGNAIQRAVSLSGGAGPRARSGLRDRAASHSHAFLLAGSRYVAWPRPN